MPIVAFDSDTGFLNITNVTNYHLPYSVYIGDRLRFLKDDCDRYRYPSEEIFCNLINDCSHPVCLQRTIIQRPMDKIY